MKRSTHQVATQPRSSYLSVDARGYQHLPPFPWWRGLLGGGGEVESFVEEQNGETEKEDFARSCYTWKRLTD